jgi:hypothetical protein
MAEAKTRIPQTFYSSSSPGGFMKPIECLIKSMIVNDGMIFKAFVNFEKRHPATMIISKFIINMIAILFGQSFNIRYLGKFRMLLPTKNDKEMNAIQILIYSIYLSECVRL